MTKQTICDECGAIDVVCVEMPGGDYSESCPLMCKDCLLQAVKEIDSHYTNQMRKQGIRDELFHDLHRCFLSAFSPLKV